LNQHNGNLAKAHDDTQFNDDLAELERMFNEVGAMHDKVIENREEGQSIT